MCYYPISIVYHRITLMKKIHVQAIFFRWYAANLSFSSSSTFIAGFLTLPCFNIHCNSHTHHTSFIHVGHFHYGPFLGRQELYPCARDQLDILVIVCILLRIHTRRNLDTYNDIKCQSSRQHDKEQKKGENSYHRIVSKS